MTFQGPVFCVKSASCTPTHSFLSGRLSADTRYNFFAVRCVELILTEFYFVHIAACIFYFIAYSYGSSNTWLGTLAVGRRSYEYYKDMPIGDLYCISLYWAVVTMATLGERQDSWNMSRLLVLHDGFRLEQQCVIAITLRAGYGDVHPVNTTEMIFAIIYIVCDLLFTAYITANFTALIVSGDSGTLRLREDIASTQRFAVRYPHCDMKCDLSVGQRTARECEKSQREVFLKWVYPECGSLW